ncbi:MAG: hypothetical protein O2945_22380 [Planctomycetota bacterium]|nr:hypothetical protein [Planctomycetota bacterium]
MTNGADHAESRTARSGHTRDAPTRDAPTRAAPTRDAPTLSVRKQSLTMVTVTVDPASERGLLLLAQMPTSVLIPRSAFASEAEAVDGLLDVIRRFIPDPMATFRLLIILPQRGSAVVDHAVSCCVAFAACHDVTSVCVVSSASAHAGASQVVELEHQVCDALRTVEAHPQILRVGRLLERSRLVTWVCRLAAWYPLVPRWLHGTFVEPLEVLLLLESSAGSRPRTLLGARRGLRDMMKQHVSDRLSDRVCVAIARVLKLLGAGLLVSVGISLLAKCFQPVRALTVKSLEPQSVDELLSLYWSSNRKYVAIAGYNTGVDHFGWKYPGRSVVQTTGTGRLVRVRKKTITVDAGVLLKRVIRELAERGQELFVVPNYSYISLGTVFMVPVHGSGSEVSTLGETVVSALIYDPALDRILKVRRGDGCFESYMYNPGSGVLVLRLTLRIRPKSRYVVRRSQVGAHDADAILSAFDDDEAANIEVRKSSSSSHSVEVSKYYLAEMTSSDGLDQARDSLGSLWDRIEETPVINRLFHQFVRTCGYHVELFLTFDEFRIFWAAHPTLPLSKIQLRYVHRDGLPHSPVGDCDRISADIFMKRKDREAFRDFMQEHLPDARYNPGKHSM